MLVQEVLRASPARLTKAARSVARKGWLDPVTREGSPLIVIPTALSVPSSSKLSRYGLARAEYAASWGVGQP
jgi:hypothetical protein